MNKLVACVLCLLFPMLAHAQVIQAKGVGTLGYTGSVSPDLKERAYVKAQLSAVERYFAESGEAESQNFEAIEDKVRENLDRFILNTVILNEQDQASLHKYSVVVRVDINVAKLRNSLRGASAVAKAGAAAKSQLVFIFVAREMASARAFDARTFKRAEAEVQDSSRKGTQTVAAQVETGGSTTRKADELEYRLLPMANTITSITSVFSQGGFMVGDAAYVIGDKDIKAINKDFSTGSDVGSSTMRSVVGTLRKAQVPLLVISTLDVGPPSQDPATGLARVAVTVSGRVLDLANPMPREVVSVPAIQIFGIGPDNLVARDKGLKDAALAAAREVVSRMNAAGIQ